MNDESALRSQPQAMRPHSSTARQDLGRLLRPIRASLVTIAVTSSAAALVALVPYVMVALVTDRLLAGTSDTGRFLTTALGVVIVALVLRQVLYIGSLGYAHMIEAKLRRTLREQILDHLGNVPLGRVATRSSGQIRRLVIDDTAAIHTIVAHVIAEAAGALIGVVASIVVLAVASWQLALGYLLVFVLVAVIARAVMPKLGPNVQAEFADAQSELASNAVELTEGIAEIKSYSLTGGFMRRFRASLDRYSAASYDGTRSVARPMSVITSVVLPGVLLGPMLVLCWVAGSFEWASPFGMIVFLLVGIGVPQTFFGALSLVQNTQLGAAAAGRITRFLDEPVLAEPTTPAPFTRADAGGDITFDHVTFAYGEGAPVLKEVSFTVPAGHTVALVGPSGSGKTTLARLLGRFWDVSEGHISIGGRQVTTISGEELLRQTAFVFQDMMLASVSVRDNIRLARPEASEDQVITAAKTARIHDRIMALPHGYDTIVGAHEAQFSGGEQQRLCIARIFLQDAPILVLDEATSFMDRETERLLREAFAEFFVGRTVITIAHRLSTITDADSIVVLDDGQLAEQGTHQELLVKDGLYRRLWDARTVEGTPR